MTNDRQHPRRIGRSIAAVGAGFIAVVILSIGTDMVLHALGILPPLGQPTSSPLLALATTYRSVYSVTGSYIAAKLAPDQPMKYAVTLGVVGLVMSTVGAAVTWNMGPAFGPHWYPVSLIVLAMPCAWLGGILYGSRNAQA